MPHTPQIVHREMILMAVIVKIEQTSRRKRALEAYPRKRKTLRHLNLQKRNPTSDPRRPQKASASAASLQLQLAAERM